MLIEDIDLSASSWTKLGTFTGELDGQGKTISGLHCDIALASGGESWGLFDTLKGATVRDINFTNVLIITYNHGDKSTFHVGALAGSANNNAIVFGITVSGIVKMDGSGQGVARVGGVIGDVADCTISNCTNNATVRSAKGSAFAGGIVGASAGSTYTNCHNTGFVNAHNMVMFGTARVGGIIGQNNGALTVVGCTHSGSLKCEGDLGNHESYEIY